MIVYRELASLVRDLGFSAKTLYSLSNHLDAHYHKARLPKGNGEYRELHIPDELLKAVQRQISKVLLFHEPISPYARAYRVCGSTRMNALPHVGGKVLLKLDIRHYFDSITYHMVKEKVFRQEKYAEPLRILLTLLCVYPDGLPQGAPTSPAISNIIMKDFDEEVGTWCRKQQIRYTRYCDDMTFSGDFDSSRVIGYIRRKLRKMGFFLNETKTKVAHDGQKKKVTGIIVNDGLSVPADYRRAIQQEVYFCRKHGVADHLHRTNSRLQPD